MSPTNIITLQAKSPTGKVKVPFESNPKPYPEYLYSCMSVFLVCLFAPNRQFSNVGSKLLRVELDS